MTKTGSAFGVELDSLVDAVSFGVAPAFIMYFAVLNREGWAWLLCFIYVASAVMRLARFNVEQGGRAKTHFHGLPSPAAGMTLATYYWFSQTPLYQEKLVGLPWYDAMKGVMLTLSALMISHVLYPAVPKVGLRSAKGIAATAAVLALVVTVIMHPYRFAFPALVLYVAYGLVRSLILGVMDRLPTGDPLYDEEDEELDAEDFMRPAAFAESPVVGRRQRRRRRRARRERLFPPHDRRTGELSE
jgi:CDP-diacylglycerol--serine O-phosphatidyltransferase